jgi:flavodoxin
VLYDSQVGMTEQVARAIAQGLQRLGEVRLAPVGDTTAADSGEVGGGEWPGRLGDVDR